MRKLRCFVTEEKAATINSKRELSVEIAYVYVNEKKILLIAESLFYKLEGNKKQEDVIKENILKDLHAKVYRIEADNYRLHGVILTEEELRDLCEFM